MLVSEVKSKDILKYSVDYLIVPTPFSLCKTVDFTVSEIKEAACKKKIILKMDRMFAEDDLVLLERYIKEVKDFPVAFYLFTDLAVYTLLCKYHLKNKSLYFAKTYLTSTGDIRAWNMLGCKCLISTEITFPELKNIASTGGNFIYVFGFPGIFYAKRKLLSLFNEYNKNSDLSLNTRYTLKECTKDDKYFIYEDKEGTLINLGYVFYLYEELRELKQDNYFYIDSAYLCEDDLLKVIERYHDLLDLGKTCPAPFSFVPFPLKKGYCKDDER